MPVVSKSEAHPRSLTPRKRLVDDALRNFSHYTSHVRFWEIGEIELMAEMRRLADQKASHSASLYGGRFAPHVCRSDQLYRDLEADKPATKLETVVEPIQGEMIKKLVEDIEAATVRM